MSRDLRIGLAVSRQERAALRRAAKAASKPLAEYMRGVLLEAAAGSVAPQGAIAVSTSTPSRAALGGVLIAPPSGAVSVAR